MLGQRQPDDSADAHPLIRCPSAESLKHTRHGRGLQEHYPAVERGCIGLDPLQPDRTAGHLLSLSSRDEAG